MFGIFKKRSTITEPYPVWKPLPWVTSGLHLGQNLSNKYDGIKLDMKLKRGKYIARNCELQQEFFFAHPDSKFELNRIYNSHMTGCPLWDLFSREIY